MTDERFSPQMYVAYFAGLRGISPADIGVAPIVVLSWGQKVIQSLSAAVGAQLCPYWFYDEDHAVFPLFTGKIQDRLISFAQVPEGASATVVMMEEMIACGASIFIGLGWAGSLQQTAPLGSVILPTRCIREEGTSLHYVGDETMLCPDKHLHDALELATKIEGARATSGVLWTTDAPYRELLTKISSYQRLGVLGVDMETSAMYALGKFRGVRVCNILVVSDELWGEWRPAFRSPEVRKATELAQRIVLKCVELIRI